MLAISAAIGVFSHLALDILMHWYNPILWPWIDPFAIVGPLVIMFIGIGMIRTTAYLAANLTTTVAMAILFLIIVYQSRGPELWSRLLIG